MNAMPFPILHAWMDELRSDNEKHEWIINKKKELQNKNFTSKYHLENWFLKNKTRILLSLISNWRKKIIEECHSALAAGHLGVLKTTHKIKKTYIS